MKKHFALLLLIIAIPMIQAQKKEKIKGSKIVTTEYREIGGFNTLLIEDNLEVQLERGEKTALKIEADDNLQSVILFDLQDNSLRLYSTKHITNYKKMNIKITYTDHLNLITSKNESTVTAIQQLLLPTVTLKAQDASKLFINANVKNFVLQADDKSKIELNLKSENATVILNKNASLKAVLTTSFLKIDQYQKTNATLEGNASNTVIRLDNNSKFIGNKFTTKKASIITESYSICSLLVEKDVLIDAANKSEIQLLGMPKIEIGKLADEAKLLKKLK